MIQSPDLKNSIRTTPLKARAALAQEATSFGTTIKTNFFVPEKTVKNFAADGHDLFITDELADLGGCFRFNIFLTKPKQGFKIINGVEIDMPTDNKIPLLTLFNTKFDKKTKQPVFNIKKIKKYYEKLNLENIHKIAKECGFIANDEAPKVKPKEKIHPASILDNKTIEQGTENAKYFIDKTLTGEVTDATVGISQSEIARIMGKPLKEITESETPLLPKAPETGFSTEGSITILDANDKITHMLPTHQLFDATVGFNPNNPVGESGFVQTPHIPDINHGLSEAQPTHAEFSLRQTNPDLPVSKNTATTYFEVTTPAPLCIPERHVNLIPENSPRAAFLNHPEFDDFENNPAWQAIMNVAPKKQVPQAVTNNAQMPTKVMEIIQKFNPNATTVLESFPPHISMGLQQVTDTQNSTSVNLILKNNDTKSFKTLATAPATTGTAQNGNISFNYAPIIKFLAGLTPENLKKNM